MFHIILLLTMTTPSHILYNLALLGKKGDRKLNIAVGLGALFPDTAVWIFFVVNKLFLGIPEKIMWDQMYFAYPWNGVFNLFHSFWLLPLLMVVSYLFKNRLGIYFFGSALLHAVFDFCVHARDAYAHFWPFSEWRFHSPISYWDRDFYGQYVSILEFLFAALAAYILYKRAGDNKWRWLFLMLFVIETGMVVGDLVMVM